MNALSAALARLAEIEAAVAAGDFEAADLAAQDLKPLLVSSNVDDLIALRQRVENLKLGVIALQADDARTLKTIQNKRGGAAVYQELSTVR